MEKQTVDRNAPYDVIILLFLHFIFCRKRVVISGLCGWPFNFGPGEQQLHTNRQQYYIRKWHNGLKSENIVPQ